MKAAAITNGSFQFNNSYPQYFCLGELCLIDDLTDVEEKVAWDFLSFFLTGENMSFAYIYWIWFLHSLGVSLLCDVAYKRQAMALSDVNTQGHHKTCRGHTQMSHPRRL